MSALTVSVLRAPLRRATENNIGCLSLAYVQSSQYSTEVRKAANLSAWKRGTGGRSSFNGVVATVFGCTGFVGRYLCNQLGKIGTQMILPYRCDHYECMPLKVVGDLGQVLFTEFDLRDEASVEKAVKYSNVVFNLCGRDYETKNFSFNDVHVKGARTIARACKKAGVDRLIHLSYLNSEEHPEPLAMRKPSGFKSSKWLGEQVVREEFPDATIIKASDIYGTGDRFLHTYMHGWRRQAKFMPLWGNGLKTEKQPVFASDVARALLNAARDPDSRGLLYQAVGPRRYKLADLVDWFHYTTRRGPFWGYYRYDMKYDPFFQIKVELTDRLSPAYPFGYLHWEGIEREATSDKVMPGVPNLEDLGVTPTLMEDQVPWELKPHRAFGYYDETTGDHEFEKVIPPPYTVA